MSALPSHVTGRPLKPLKPRRSEGNAETMPDAIPQSQQSMPSSLLSQSGYSHDERSGHRRHPSHPQAEKDAHQLNEADFSMEGLEVGLSQTRRYPEQTSHGTAQHALAAMRRDADIHEANEHRRKYERRDSGFMESVSMETSAAPEKKKDSAVPRDAKQLPLPSLAATHPSLYGQPTARPVPSMPSSALSDDILEVAPSQAHRPSRPLANPWQIYSDPKQAKQPSPAHDGTRIESREASHDARVPNVVSPVRMITLPYGTNISIACDYDAEVDDDEYVAQG